MHTSSPQATLIQALMKPDFYDHPVFQCELIETHISWVILTGDFAYKVKKPVNLGFLDFSTLDKRHFYCNEELRLNRRLAPSIYLDVLPIYGPLEQPSFDAQDVVIEYAVKMRQFPQQAQLDRILAHGQLQYSKIDAIADMIAAFHAEAAVADMHVAYGDVAHVLQPVTENFCQIQERISEHDSQALLAEVQEWSESNYSRLAPVFRQRKVDGFIRECHGDLHLRNLAWFYGAPLAFDCLEFNPDLRWIDVISEVAFLIMDLQDHAEDALAQRFLNAYLEHSGDYAGLTVLRYYLVYRAMVRAKVAAIAAAQDDLEAEHRDTTMQEFYSYLHLARRYIMPVKPHLIITRGLSASGKTTETQPLLEQLGAIRIRSDVERKRLFGMHAQDRALAATGKGIYTEDASRRTYAYLLELCEQILNAGYSVIVDAACLKREQRLPFQQLAGKLQLSYTILEYTAKADTLRKRIMERKNDASDANLQVLEHQLQHWQALENDELEYAIHIDTEKPYDVTALLERIRSRNTSQARTCPSCQD